MLDVACLGLLVADVVAQPIKTYPERGKLVLVDHLELHAGGCAVNTAIALAKLGLTTSVIGKVGRDSFGQFILDRLRSQKIRTAGIMRDVSVKTAATMVMVGDDGERSFVHCPGANAQLQTKDIDFERIKKHRLLHLGGALLMPKFDGQPAAQLLRRAKSQGLLTSLDTVWDATGRWLDLLEPCLPHIDYFLPSYEEAHRLSNLEAPERMADFFLARGVKVVGLKMGERGCFIKDGTMARQLPALPVAVVDTTGAGDGFVAGFLAGVLRGWDMERVGRLANAVGACCVSALGAGDGLKDYAQVAKMLEETG